MKLCLYFTEMYNTDLNAECLHVTTMLCYEFVLDAYLGQT